jgi:alpha-beta hydrolase superfamily lysophospholipase
MVRTHRRPALVTVVVVVALVAVVGLLASVILPPGPAGAATGTSASAPGPSPASLAAFYRPPRPLPAGPPGEVIRSMAVPTGGGLPPGATAFRVLYLSQTIRGTDVAVSGLVVVPGGRAPADGFPIVSWAHGTTGLADQCAPSLSGVASIPSLAALIDRRLIVVATDYQGLGTPGIPPYLVGASEAQNVLDAARAARNLVGHDASNVVAVLGFSQGGQASLFASQIAPSYAPELFVAGAVAVAPVTSLDELIPARPSGRHDPGAVYAVTALDAWARVYGNLDLSDALTRWSAGRARALSDRCSGSLAPTYDSVPGRDVFRSGWHQAPGLGTDVTDNDPGRSGTATPLLVVEGSDDTVTPTRAAAGFVADQLCRTQHDTVQYLPVPGAGHGSVLQAATPEILEWITRRLTGAPVRDSCASGRGGSGSAG